MGEGRVPAVEGLFDIYFTGTAINESRVTRIEVQTTRYGTVRGEYSPDFPSVW